MKKLWSWLKRFFVREESHPMEYWGWENTTGDDDPKTLPHKWE